MGNTYNQLTLGERYQIKVLNDQNLSARSIAKQLHRSNKTISEELKRCAKGEYCPETANAHAIIEKKSARKAQKRSATRLAQVKSLLLEGMSPEQISGRMDLESIDCISFQTIYRWASEFDWRELLPRRGKKRRSRASKEAGAHLIPDRVDIDERPAIVDKKVEIGHWEGDTVYGQDGYLVTLVERESKLLLTKRVKNKRKDTVCNAVCELLAPYKSMCKTITFDNGGEFASHKKMSKRLGCNIYFAKPYHSWQRGLNENTNGLLRRYFPKGMSIYSVTSRKIKEVQQAINARPRKALNYLNPIEFLTGQRVSLIM